MDTVNHGYHFDTTEDDYGVRWGRWRKTTERFKFYDSFHLDGEEFSVKDTVYLQTSDGPPYIARIDKLREKVGTRKKDMLVRWFFRPCELPEGLPTVDYSRNSKEVFMAVGSEYAKKFQNPACTIKKCSVVCIADETWSRMPPSEQVAAADHVFDRAFDPVKLRLEKLNFLKGNCDEYLGLIIPGKELKVGSSSYCGQTEKRNGKHSHAIAMMTGNPGLHSKTLMVGKPPKRSSGILTGQADHPGKLEISQKYPSAILPGSGKRPGVDAAYSCKRPRMNTPEEQITRKSAPGGWINDKERSSEHSGRQEFPQSEKKRKIDDFVMAEVQKAHLSAAVKGVMDRGRLSSQSGSISDLPLNRVSKVPSLDGKKTSEKKYGGSVPLLSSRRVGEESGLTRDREARKAAALGKRSREESLASITVKQKLADLPRPHKRAVECHLESPPLRPNVSLSHNAGSPLSESKRRKDSLWDGLKEVCNGANLKKSTSGMTARGEKLVKKEGKDFHKDQNHLSSVSITSERKNTLKTEGAEERRLVEHVSKSLKNGAKIRVAAKSHSKDILERPERAVDRNVKRAESHIVVEGFGSSVNHGRALSTGNHLIRHYKRDKKIFKFPWDEKKSVEEAVSKGRALLLKNLDPCLNSIEIETILENTMDTTCDVRILPPKIISCYKSAEAIVVFKKAEVAEDVLRTLMENLLILSEDERPVLVSLLTRTKQSINNFHGFLNLAKFGWKTNDSVDQKNAVATSHCAQINTVEYDMGLHWRVLQDRATLEWEKLEEDHQRELQEVKAKYQKS